ncbi:hypothetical protein PCASD_16025 [Puccinia coronata f. sp. avenae]|uniref:Uncharacterized protein n=1 Tax=Puccinia coronata f. sp. avenae TaxID=200324 RepID=A0A2N5TZT2_9BASI|nr:hypothetical protein PCASD_16025 [Puccinia coronata f. sp. avenae]
MARHWRAPAADRHKPTSPDVANPAPGQTITCRDPSKKPMDMGPQPDQQELTALESSCFGGGLVQVNMAINVKIAIREEKW